MKGGEHFCSLIKGHAVSVVGVLSILWLAGDLLSFLCYQNKPNAKPSPSLSYVFLRFQLAGFTGAQLALAALISCPCGHSTGPGMIPGLWEMEKEPGQGGRLVRAL